MEENSKTGVELIAEERQRQIEKEGWTPAHDDEHCDEELARVAALYALPDYFRLKANGSNLIKIYPINSWAAEWWKPTPNNRIRELVKAGALIAAEIDRLQRLNPKSV